MAEITRCKQIETMVLMTALMSSFNYEFYPLVYIRVKEIEKTFLLFTQFFATRFDGAKFK